MKSEVLKVKEWFFEKIKDEASRYNTYLDADYEDGELVVEDGCVFAQIEERIAESEKAIKVRFASGHIDGSCKGWTTWVPKSIIMPL